jgi:drug/metabolite transporter (DMT)-like permease
MRSSQPIISVPHIECESAAKAGARLALRPHRPEFIGGLSAPPTIVEPVTAEPDLQIQHSPRVAAQSSWRVVLAITVTMVAWASAFVVIRYVGQDYDPGSLTLGRLIVGGAALSLMMIGRRVVRMTRREWGLVAITGVAWFAIYSIALNAGEQLVDAGTAAMLIQLAPILIGVLAGVVLREGFPRNLVVGGLVAFAGTVLIGVSTSTGHANLVGVLLVLLSATTYSIAMIAQKSALRRLPALQVTWLGCLIGMVASLPFAGELVHDVASARLVPTLGVLYLGLVPTALAFSTWAYALSKTTAGRLGVTTYAVPPITIALSWAFLGEIPALLAVVGGVISLVGVGIARRR